MKSNNPLGRGKGTPNKLTVKEKEWIFEGIKEKCGNLNNYINLLPPQNVPKTILAFVPYLIAKCNPKQEEASEVQVLLLNSIKPHIKKLGTYIDMLPMEERVVFLIKALALLTPKQRGYLDDIDL